MADKKLSQESSLTKSTVATNDLIYTADVSANITKSMTYQEMMQPTDANFRIAGSSDNTKLVAFEVDGLTTATTRTITIPDSDTTMVGTGLTQTLTNKTLSTGTTFNGYNKAVVITDASGVASALTGTSGQIVSFDTSNVPVAIANPSASDADISTKGVSEKATTAEINAGTATGGTGASLFMSPDQFISSNYAIAQTDVQIFTANGTWTKPTNAKSIEVIVIGAGGGGGGPNRTLSTTGGSGGGGGSYIKKTFNASDLGSTVSVTVGTGGIGGTQADGTVGGTSNFGSLLYAYGGGGGLKQTVSANSSGGGGGGYGSVGSVGVSNADSTGGYPNDVTVGLQGVSGGGGGGKNGANGKSAEFGGAAGGGGAASAAGFNGGSSLYGGGGGGAGGGNAALYAGGAGGNVLTITAGGGGAGGTSGGNGTAGTNGDSTKCGTGGGGGGGTATGAAGNGGAGGIPGGGGGGGGVSGNSTDGIGGTGGRGQVTVITHFA